VKVKPPGKGGRVGLPAVYYALWDCTVVPGGDKLPGLGHFDLLFVVCAFLFQIILIVHFSLRKWRFDIAMRYGPIVYSLGLPAAAASLALLLGGMVWSFWLAGFIYLAWGTFGYVVEYVKKIQWRTPIHWPVFGPYVFLYLATAMFYWFPLALLWKPLWYAYALLFAVSTLLNVTSHKGAT
jgi:hypothetical protein